MSILSGSDFVRDHFCEAAFARSRRAVGKNLKVEAAPLTRRICFKIASPILRASMIKSAAVSGPIVIWTLIFALVTPFFSSAGAVAGVCLLFQVTLLNERLPAFPRFRETSFGNEMERQPARRVPALLPI